MTLVEMECDDSNDFKHNCCFDGILPVLQQCCVAEKLLALSDRARHEPRDPYDLWYLFGSTNLRIAEMRTELDAQVALRQRVVAGMEQPIVPRTR